MPEDVTVRRARLPDAYGLPPDSPCLTWAAIEAKLVAAQHYWIATTGNKVAPIVRPVDGLWLNGCLYFSGSPLSRWRRNLAANPNASVSLADAQSPVILEGTAVTITPSTALGDQLAAAAATKYSWATATSDVYRGECCRFRPTVCLAWTLLYKDATRFTFS